MPAAWQPVAPAERSRGLDSEQLAVLSPESDLSTMVVATFGTAGERSLIPRALAQLVHRSRSQPRVTSLAGHPAWTYRALNARRWNLVLDVTVLPTREGMLALACSSPAPSRDAGRGCAAPVKSVSLPGVTTLQASPSVALTVQLPAVLARLDQARVDGRAALGRARTSEAQAVALQRLADQHLAAADRLHTAFGAAARPLIAGLQDSGRAYAALGRAASDGSPARFGAARQEVRVAEAELGDAVDRIREAGTRDTAANASTSPRATAIEPTRPVVSKLVLLILVLLASAAAGFLASGPITHATSKLWRPTSRPVA